MFVSPRKKRGVSTKVLRDPSSERSRTGLGAGGAGVVETLRASDGGQNAESLVAGTNAQRIVRKRPAGRRSAF